MAIVLALLAAVAYGVADYVAGVIAQRASPWQVATTVSTSAALCSLPLILLEPGSPTGSDWGWAVAGGLAAGFGSVFLYRGLSTGTMSVVAPLSAVVAALIPVGVGLGIGERPSALALLGVAIALPAIALIARSTDEPTIALIARSTDEPAIALIARSTDEPTSEPRSALARVSHPAGQGAPGHPAPQQASAAATPDSPRAPRAARAGVLDGLLAGVGFGLLFVAAGRMDESAGLGPAGLIQASSVLSIAALGTVFGEAWVPRQREARRAWVVGPIVIAAVALVLVANHSGLLSVVSVITSLYPAVTVLLAATLLGERLDRSRAAGLALAAGAVVLVVTG